MKKPPKGPPRGGGDHEVGYGKPPVHTRFRKGRSGNPAGRPRGSRDLATLLGAELDKPVAVREGGGSVRKVRKRDALVAGLVNKALQGDLRAARLLLLLQARPGAAEERAAEADGRAPSSDTDREIIASYLARMGRQGGGDAEEE
jgi:Family of unknown function (DUF5681)